MAVSGGAPGQDTTGLPGNKPAGRGCRLAWSYKSAGAHRVSSAGPQPTPRLGDRCVSHYSLSGPQSCMWTSSDGDMTMGHAAGTHSGSSRTLERNQPSCSVLCAWLAAGPDGWVAAAVRAGSVQALTMPWHSGLTPALVFPGKALKCSTEQVCLEDSCPGPGAPRGPVLTLEVVAVLCHLVKWAR